MGVLADRIEKLILDKLLEQEHNLILKRNDLADELNCAPSQISYVLSTRFSTERGFNVESRRGLGGFISITRIQSDTGAGHTTVTTTTGHLPVPISGVPQEQLPLEPDMPQSIQEIDRWLGMQLFHERLTPREARLLHSAFEGLFHQVPNGYAANAIRMLYRAVQKEVRGE